MDDLLEIVHERSDDVELVGVEDQMLSSAFGLIPPLLCGQIDQPEPLNLADLFSRLGHKIGVLRDTTEDEELHVLGSHGLLDVFDPPRICDQAGSFDVEASLFPCFADSAIQVVFILVYLAAREAPRAILLPAFDQQDLVHVVVQQDSAANWHTVLVLQETVEGISHVLLGPVLEERASLCDALEERFQAEGRQGWVKWTDEVLVEPLCFLDLEAYSLDAGKFFCGYVDNEPDTEVI